LGEIYFSFSGSGGGGGGGSGSIRISISISSSVKATSFGTETLLSYSLPFVVN
jgi:hypothetical protein